jgi:cytochrome oxidase Cu insertion factor (SCO1/SenC/PrrC family)
MMASLRYVCGLVLFAAYLVHPAPAVFGQRAATDSNRARSTPVKVGEEAPDFTLEDVQGNEVRLSAARGLPTILVFYRGYW